MPKKRPHHPGDRYVREGKEVSTFTAFDCDGDEGEQLPPETVKEPDKIREPHGN